MKNIILIIGSITIIAAVARGMWAWQQVQKEESAFKASITQTQEMPVAESPVTKEVVTTSQVPLIGEQAAPVVLTGPKGTMFAMSSEFESLLANAKVDFNKPEEAIKFVKSSVYVQFLEKYLTNGKMNEYQQMSDTQKHAFLMFGLVLVIPEKDTNIQETIAGNSAILKYRKSMGVTTVGGTSSPLLGSCSIKMILENKTWRVDIGDSKCSTS